MKTLLLLLIILSTTLNAETLYWDSPSAESEGVVNHTIYSWLEGDTQETSIEILMPIMSYELTVANYIKGETYCFQLTASNLNGESARSEVLCQTLYLEIPSVPIEIIIE